MPKHRAGVLLPRRYELCKLSTNRWTAIAVSPSTGTCKQTPKRHTGAGGGSYIGLFPVPRRPTAVSLDNDERAGFTRRNHGIIGQHVRLSAYAKAEKRRGGRSRNSLVSEAVRTTVTMNAETGGGGNRDERESHVVPSALPSLPFPSMLLVPFDRTNDEGRADSGGPRLRAASPQAQINEPSRPVP